MIAKFFKEPVYSNGSWSTFQNDFITATGSISAFEYDEQFTKPGDFTLTLPFNADAIKLFAAKGIVNGTVYVDGCWLWVQGISYDDKTIVITGKDCRGMLSTRITEYADAQETGTEGYDVAAGSTLDCIWHYINNNGAAPADTARLLPFTGIEGAEGTPSDSYMSRLEVLTDVIERLCTDADIGYKVVGNLQTGGFKVVTIKGVDRSHEQNDRPRVIFSASHRNVTAQRFEHGVDNMYNAIYATDSSDTLSIVHRDDTPASGLSRRECTISAGISSTAPETGDYFDRYVLNEVSDNVETHSFDITVRTSGYGTDYNIGDYVSVQDDCTKERYKMQITGVRRSYSSGQINIGIVLGKPKQKPLQMIVNNFISGTARRR